MATYTHPYDPNDISSLSTPVGNVGRNGKSVPKGSIPGFEVDTGTKDALTGVVTGAGMGLTAGLAKYPAVVLDKLFNALSDPNNPRTSTALSNPKSWGQSLSDINKFVEDTRNAAPASYLAGNLLGAIGTAPVMGGGTLLQVGKSALYGGLSGFNEHQDLTQAGEGALLGGLTSGILSGGAKLAGQLTPKILQSNIAQSVKSLFGDSAEYKSLNELQQADVLKDVSKNLNLDFGSLLKTSSKNAVNGAIGGAIGGFGEGVVENAFGDDVNPFKRAAQGAAFGSGVGGLKDPSVLADLVKTAGKELFNQTTVRPAVNALMTQAAETSLFEHSFPITSSWLSKSADTIAKTPASNLVTSTLSTMQPTPEDPNDISKLSIPYKASVQLAAIEDPNDISKLSKPVTLNY